MRALILAKVIQIERVHLSPRQRQRKQLWWRR